VIANRLIAALCTPYTINDKTIVIGASVGIAVISKNISEPADVMRHADMALYRARMRPQPRLLYDIDMDTDLLKRKQLVTLDRHAQSFSTSLRLKQVGAMSMS